MNLNAAPAGNHPPLAPYPPVTEVARRGGGCGPSGWRGSVAAEGWPLRQTATRVPSGSNANRGARPQGLRGPGSAVDPVVLYTYAPLLGEGNARTCRRQGRALQAGSMLP